MNFEERIEELIDRLQALVAEIDGPVQGDLSNDEFWLFEAEYIKADQALEEMKGMLRKARLRREEK